MDAKCRCEKCGKVNIVGTNDVKKRTVYEVGDTGHMDPISVTYYECICGHVNVVQADNRESKKVLKELMSVIYRVMRQGAKARDRNRRDKKEAELLEIREGLKEQARGKDFYDEEGKIFIKSLTFSTDSNII